MKMSHVIFLAAMVVVGSVAVLAGLGYYVHVQEQAAIQRLPEASAIKQALAAKMAYEKEQEAMKEVERRKEEIEKRLEEEKQAHLKLAQSLKLLVRMSDEYKSYSECKRTGWIIYKYDTFDTDCVRILFVKRAKSNKALMGALQLTSAAGLSIVLADEFVKLDQRYLVGKIYIDANADDQTIIKYLTENAEINNK